MDHHTGTMGEPPGPSARQQDDRSNGARQQDDRSQIGLPPESSPRSGHALRRPSRPASRRPWRLLLLVGAGLAVLAGLYAALIRLGLATTLTAESLGDSHGVLMVYGFVGTAITLERAVALQSDRRASSRLAYAVPACSGLAVVALLVEAATAGAIVPGGERVPGLLWCAAMAGLLAIYGVVWRRQPSYAVIVQALGAFMGLVGIALWARGIDVTAIVVWWAGFLVLTIAGERLELARIAFAAGATQARVTAEAAALVLAAGIAMVSPAIGYPLAGLALAALAIDLAWHDVARLTVRSPGLPRLAATCMLTGYGWAVIAGCVWMIGGPAFDGYRYDLVVHAITIGFVVSMIVAHAPVIVPAIARRPMPFHPVFWAVWGCLQAGLVIRTVAGARADLGAWQFGGAINVAAMLAFVISVVTLTVVGGTTRRAAPPEEAR